LVEVPGWLSGWEAEAFTRYLTEDEKRGDWLAAAIKRSLRLTEHPKYGRLFRLVEKYGKEKRQL